MSNDLHVRGRWLSDLILGAQDGIVNTLGVLLGVSAATSESRIVVATGLAAAVAESLSMAAVAYTSTAARDELYRAEREREHRHIRVSPMAERAEIRDLFARRGFDGALLEATVERICANPEVWVDVMMAEEHRLLASDPRASLRSAAVVGVSALVASLLPVVPFQVRGGMTAKLLAVVAGGLLLFSLGWTKATLTAGSRLRAGLTLAGIGLASALLGYLVGSLATVR